MVDTHYKMLPIFPLTLGNGGDIETWRLGTAGTSTLAESIHFHLLSSTRPSVGVSDGTRTRRASVIGVLSNYDIFCTLDLYVAPYMKVSHG